MTANIDDVLEDDITFGTHELTRIQIDALRDYLASFDRMIDFYSTHLEILKDSNGQDSDLIRFDYRKLQRKDLIRVQRAIESLFEDYAYLNRDQENDRLGELKSNYDLLQTKLMGIDLLVENKFPEFIKAFDVRYAMDPKFKARVNRELESCPLPDYDTDDPAYV